MNIGARVVLCGMVATYEGAGTDVAVGQFQVGQLIMKRASLHGFLVLDHAHRFGEIAGELAGHLAAGRIRADETVVDGIEKAPDALARMFAGQSTGKVLVRVAP